MIEFKYKLIGTGWAECSLQTKNSAVIITASYLDDALDNLSRAIRAILKGANYSNAIFTEEPGEYRWVFNVLDENKLRIRIVEYDDLWLGLPDEDGKIIFEDIVEKNLFICKFLSEIDILIDTYGMH